jgi:hypothetical protein
MGLLRERPERTAQGYRRFQCGNCGKEFNERSDGVLNRAQYPSDPRGALAAALQAEPAQSQGRLRTYARPNFQTGMPSFLALSARLS